MASFTRVLEWVFLLFFAFHVPITVLFDLQIALPASFSPQAVKDLSKWYMNTFKDPFMIETPLWFLTFVYCEAFLHLPFFPVAVYAFYQGGCKWIRIPAIIYSTHVSTCVLPIIVELLFADFSSFKLGPLNLQERLALVALYAPYLLIPLLLLNTMLYNPHYQSEEKWDVMSLINCLISKIDIRGYFNFNLVEGRTTEEKHCKSLCCLRRTQRVALCGKCIWMTSYACI
uniref:Sigma intracellular receptor 2 isoform X2 n=1 Tax=Geotrypetes seraphini TaxID=260995 RepID=A0A6P8NN03_GEOSA|nr:sigma intracellular receptor 2 isoform X2 [Geotrypetes seraphini]